MDPDQEIEFDFSPYLILYKSGRIYRLTGMDVVPAGTDPKTGVISKDVIINHATGLSARLFLPPNTDKKLPIIVYYHGGAFVIESPFSTIFTTYLNSMTAEANIVAVSVHYRLAPEHPVPTAYDDSLAALQWVASHTAGSGPEPWLAKHGDFNRVFLAGDSAGANICHNVLVRLGTFAAPKTFSNFKIKGMALMNPYFWGREPVGLEPTDPESRLNFVKGWALVTGSRVGLESPWVDPIVAGRAELAGLKCERVRVSVAGLDRLRERGVAYYKTLKGSGWGGEAELYETVREEHDYFLFKPENEEAVAEMRSLVKFINRK